jgi:PII-like signaling protein
VGRRLYITALLLLLLVDAVAFWHWTTQQVSRPYQLGYGEGIVLYQASKVMDLGSAYKPIDQYPFVVFHYPPLYHLTIRALALVTGSLVSSGRWLSVISGLSIELTIGLLVFLSLPRRLELSPRLVAAAFAGLLPNLLSVMMWTPLARVDMLALLLSFAGLAAFVLSGRQKAWEYLAFVLFISALFTKQTMIAGPLACLTAAMIEDVKHAVRLALFAGLMGATVLAALAWATHGEVIRHLFVYNQNPFSLSRMVTRLSTNFEGVIPLVALAGGCVVWAGLEVAAAVRRKRWCMVRAWLSHSKYRRSVLICVLFLISAVLVSFTSGKEGATYNYFLEWNLACCPLAGCALFRGLYGWRDSGRSTSVLAVAYVLPILIAIQGIPAAVKRLRPPDSAETLEEAETEGANAAMLNLINQAQGPVFSEDMMLLYKAGKEVPAEPAIIKSLATNGMWDEGPFLKMIEEHRFPMIVVFNLSTERYTPTVRAAIERWYSRTREIGRFKVYEPRSDH